MNKIPLIGRFNGMYDLSSELLSSSLSFHFVHTLINYGARLYMFAGLTADTSRISRISRSRFGLLFGLSYHGSLVAHIDNSALEAFAVEIYNRN